MKDYWKEPTQKKINKKKIITIVVIIMIAVIMVSLMTVYSNNKSVREWIDKNIFQKEVVQDNVTTIELTEGQNANIHAFNKYIGILNKNKFSIYFDTQY